MNAWIRAATTPLLVLSLGALFWNQYQGGFSVAESWPALLVLGGLLRVADHLTRDGQPAEGN
jgi:uncharacterized membrane protein YwaF